MAQVLARHMELEGHTVILVPDGEKGMEEFHRHKVDLVLTDLKLPVKSGLEVLHEVKEENPMVPVVVMTAYGTIETAVKAVKEGAFDFLQKPVDPDHLLLTIGKALEARQLVTENLIRRKSSRRPASPRWSGRAGSCWKRKRKRRRSPRGPRPYSCWEKAAPARSSSRE